MSYKLEKPYTTKERADFIVEYNHNRGLKIEETENALYALEPDEIMGENGIPIKDPDFETKQAEEQKQARIDEIKAELEELDRQSQRSARAVALCSINNVIPNPDDVNKLTEFENRAKELRAELQELKTESEIPF